MMPAMEITTTSPDWQTSSCEVWPLLRKQPDCGDGQDVIQAADKTAVGEAHASPYYHFS